MKTVLLKNVKSYFSLGNANSNKGVTIISTKVMSRGEEKGLFDI